MLERKSKKLLNVNVKDNRILFAICLIISLLMLLRAFFGIELTDEAYYYADTYSVLKGNLPYSYNSSEMVGMTFLMLLPMKIYRMFVPNMDGIFLYMRICFLIFKVLILTGVFIIFKRQYSLKSFFIMAIMLLPWYGAIPAFSYNTIPFFIFILVVSCIDYYLTDKKNIGVLYLAGFLSGIGVFTHPLYISGVICILFYLGFRTDEKKIHSIIIYSLGGITEFLVVMLPLYLETGNKLIEGIYNMVFQRVEIKANYSVFTDLLHSFKPTIFYVFILGLIISLILLRIKNKFLDLRKTDRVICSILLAFITVNIYYLYRKTGVAILEQYGFIGLVCILVGIIYFKSDILKLTGLIYIPFVLCEILFTSTNAPSDRIKYLYPCFVIFILVVVEYGNRIIKEMAIGLGCLTALTLVYTDFNYIYREKVITELDTKVETGIYKGLYTTSSNAANVEQLEQYIEQNLDINHRTSFRDNVPFAYLMYDGNICDIRTWDAMQYSYKERGTNDPVNMYRYYKRTDSIPDMYVYIDFGRDEILSCDDPTWKFNEWLYSYYGLKEESILNEKFRIKIFEYNGGFDGNYDYWIES